MIFLCAFFPPLITIIRPSGEQFKVEKGYTDSQLVPGDIVSFTYSNFFNYGFPTNAKITRVRKDLSWEDLELEYKEKWPKLLKGMGFRRGERKLRVRRVRERGREEGKK